MCGRVRDTYDPLGVFGGGVVTGRSVDFDFAPECRWCFEWLEMGNQCRFLVLSIRESHTVSQCTFFTSAFALTKKSYLGIPGTENCDFGLKCGSKHIIRAILVIELESCLDQVHRLFLHHLQSP